VMPHIELRGEPLTDKIIFRIFITLMQVLDSISAKLTTLEIYPDFREGLCSALGKVNLTGFYF